MGYTRTQILRLLQPFSSDLSQLYKEDCINYRSKTTDTKEYCTEVIAQWLLERLPMLEAIKTITRQASYRREGHDGIPPNPNSNRKEEMIAMAMKRQGEMNLVGRVLDYQTPLKNTSEDKKAGKIDLLAYDGKTLRILELKEPDSKETMLRCVLEGYTYLETVDQKKLLEDFELPADTPVEACPLVFDDGFQQQEMQQPRPYLRQLMQALNTKPFYVQEKDGTYFVTED